MECFFYEVCGVEEDEYNVFKKFLFVSYSLLVDLLLYEIDGV